MVDAWGGAWGVAWGTSWQARDVVVPAAEQPTGGWGRRGFTYTREEYERLVRRRFVQPELRRGAQAALKARSRGLIDEAFETPEIKISGEFQAPVLVAFPPSYEVVKRAVEQQIARQRLIDELLSEAQFRAIEEAAFQQAMAEADDEDAITALLLTI